MHLLSNHLCFMTLVVIVIDFLSLFLLSLAEDVFLYLLFLVLVVLANYPLLLLSAVYVHYSNAGLFYRCDESFRLWFFKILLLDKSGLMLLLLYLFPQFLLGQLLLLHLFILDSSLQPSSVIRDVPSAKRWSCSSTGLSSRNFSFFSEAISRFR